MFFYVFMKDFTRTEVSLPDRYMYILSEISRGLDIPFLIAQNNTKILTFKGGGGVERDYKMKCSSYCS